MTGHRSDNLKMLYELVSHHKRTPVPQTHERQKIQGSSSSTDAYAYMLCASNRMSSIERHEWMLIRETNQFPQLHG
jgi:hypothetical protein